MKRLALFALLFCGVVSVLAAEPVFALRLVAEHPGPLVQEYQMTSERGGNPEKVFLEPEVLLDASDLRSASIAHEGFGPVIAVTLTDAGSKRFADLTTQYQRRRFGFVIDGQLRSAPAVREPILGGSLEISGSFTRQEATDLAAALDKAARAAPSPTPDT